MAAETMQGKEILERLEKVPEAEEYPEADAVVIRDGMKLTLQEDGRVTKRHYRFRRMLTDFDRDKRCDPAVLFDETKQEITILSAKAIMRDGRVVESPEYAVNRITPAYLAQAPHFTDFQEQIVSLVGLQRHGFTEFEYEIEDKEPWQPTFCGSIPLRIDEPTLSREIVFEVPEARAMTFSVRGMEEGVYVIEETIDGGVKRTRFEFGDLPLWDPEDNHPLMEADRPTLIYGETASWDELAAGLADRVAEAAILDERIEKRVDELLKEIECPIQGAYRLQKHVLESIATVDFHPRHNHFAARPAPEVLRSGYGNHFEKAMLLCAMLRKAGHQADVALACPVPALPEPAVHLGVFDSSWVLVPSLDLFFRPDKDAGAARRAHLQGHVLLVGTKEAENRLSLEDPGHATGNCFSGRVKLKVAKDGSAEGTVEAMLAGVYNPYFNLYDEDTDKVEKWVKGFVGKVGCGSEPEKHHFKHFAPSHSALSASCKVKRMKEDADHRFVLQFPSALGDIGGFKIPNEIVTRLSTYALPGTLRHTLEVELELPDGIELLVEPEELRVESEVGELEQRVEKKEEEGKPTKITFFQRLRFGSRFVRPEAYAAFRGIVVEDARPQNRVIFLRHE